MMSAFFSFSTRRVSISLYQRARYSSFVQGTLPASQLPTESLSNGGNLTRKQVPKKKGVIASKNKKGEKKPKHNSSPQYTQLKSHGEMAAQHGIKIEGGGTWTIPGGLTIVHPPRITMVGGIAHQKATMAAGDKECLEFLAELRSRFPKKFSGKDLDKFVAEWESRRG